MTAPTPPETAAREAARIIAVKAIDRAREVATTKIFKDATDEIAALVEPVLLAFRRAALEEVAKVEAERYAWSVRYRIRRVRRRRMSQSIAVAIRTLGEK